MKNKLLSIIVPVYNVEQYLSKCIESIIQQTYDNYELILVDDGTPDNSGLICDNYAKQFSQIKVIHKANGGLSSARNAGLDIAKGEYIAFVDSDDWIEPTIYSDMIDCIEKYSCDLVECGINLVYENYVKPYDSTLDIYEVIDGKEALRRHLDIFNRTNQSIPRTAVWSKLFKRSFWENNRFPEGEIHEDYLLTCMALYESSIVGIIHKGLLNHLTCNPNSIVNTRFSKRDLYKEKQLKFRINYLDSQQEHLLKSKAIEDYYNYLPSAIWRCHLNNMPTECKYFINKISIEKTYIYSINLPIKRKLEYLCLFLMPSLYLWLRKLVSKHG